MKTTQIFKYQQQQKEMSIKVIDNYYANGLIVLYIDEPPTRRNTIRYF